MGTTRGITLERYIDGESSSARVTSRERMETFTDQVIRKVNEKEEKTVFILWGAFARKKSALIDHGRHHVIESSHPSPLSAHRGFFGSRPFSEANRVLKDSGREPVNWSL